MSTGPAERNGHGRHAWRPYGGLNEELTVGVARTHTVGAGETIAVGDGAHDFGWRLAVGQRWQVTNRATVAEELETTSDRSRIRSTSVGN